MSERYVNAYVDGDEILLLHRDDSGVHVRRERPEYVAYFREEELGARLKDLRREPGLAGASEPDEHGWVRTRWLDRNGYNHYGTRRDALRSIWERWEIPSYEGDVSPARRWLIDHDAVMGRPRRVFFDMETDSRVPFARKEEMRILSWCAIGEDGREQVGVLDSDDDASERRLVEGMMRALMPYDQVLAWYGDGFDFPVWQARARKQGIRVGAIKRWLLLDQMENHKRQNMHGAQSGAEKRSFALDAVAQELLGYGKADFDASQTYQEWAAGGSRRDKMVQYMVQDVRCQVGIEKKTGYVDLLNEICEYCGTLPDSWGMQPTSQVDGIMFRLGKRIGQHFPTKTFGGPQKRQFEGAYVLKPTCSGIQRDVHVFDFSGMYPSIIQTFNMSPETKRPLASSEGPIAEGCCRTPTTGTTFATAPCGILAQAVWEVGEIRGRVDAQKNQCVPQTPEWNDLDRKSQALKVMRNAFFGVVGSSYSRFHDEAIAEGITKTGKYLIENTLEAARERGGTAIFSDTDSGAMIGMSMAQMGEFVKWCNVELYPKLVADQGCAENHIKLAFEKSFERLVIPASKKYIARLHSYKGKLATVDSKPEIKGMEYKRGDAGVLTAKLQGEVIDLLCGGLKLARVDVPTERVEDYEECVERHRAHVLSDPLPVEEVQLAKGLSRELAGYASKTKKDGGSSAGPIHVRVAREMEERGEDVTAGTKIRYVVVDGHSSPKQVIPASAYTGECDRAHLWNTIVYPATERLLLAAFPDHPWAKWRLERTRAGKPRFDSGQGDLFEGMPAAAPMVPRKPPPRAQDAPREALPRVVRLRADQGGRARLEALRAVAEAFPGRDEIPLEVDTGEGVAVMTIRVDASEEFWQNVGRVMRTNEETRDDRTTAEEQQDK